MDGPLEIDSRGRDTHNDPRYYVITDRFGREICDTLNCHHLFTLEEQERMMLDLCAAMNRSLEGGF